MSSNYLPHPTHRPINGPVDPAMQHERNTQMLQVLHNNAAKIGKMVASNASRIILTLVMVAVVGAIALGAFSMSTFNVISNVNTYYPLTRNLDNAIFGNDAPLQITVPYNATLQCPTTSGRADLCTYFSYVNHTIAVFNQFMLNGTIENDTLSQLPYTNPSPYMTGVGNGKEAIDALVVAVTNVSAAGSANAAEIVVLETSVGSTFYVERAAVGGADTSTCGRHPLFPCATPAYALTHIAAMASSNVSLVLQLGAGLFVAPALTLPCNLALRGQGAATTLVTAGLSIGSGTGCSNAIDALNIQLTGASNLTLVGLMVRNVTFIGAPAYPLYIVGPPSPIGEVVFDNVDLAGLSVLSLQDAAVDARSLLHGRIVVVTYTVLGGRAELHDFQIGSTSFTFSTLATGVSTTLMGYGWSNPTTAPWTIVTASGSTTIFRGDDGTIGLINANSTFYGAIASGGGTLNTQRESGAVGQAYSATAPSTWAVSGVPVQTNDALDKLSARVFAGENAAGRDITIFDGITSFSSSSCSPLFPPAFDLPGATKHVTGTDYFQMSQTQFIALEYTGLAQAVFRVTFIFHASIDYTAGDNLGAGFCILNEGAVASCTGEYPSLPFALRAAGTTGQVVGFTLDRLFTFSPSQKFVTYAYIFIPTITSCTLMPDMVQFEFLYFT